MKVLSSEVLRNLEGDVTISSSALTRNLEFQLGLMEKQIKRVAELARFLPFADQQEEMHRLAKQLSNVTAFLKFFVLAMGDTEPKATEDPPHVI